VPVIFPEDAGGEQGRALGRHNHLVAWGWQGTREVSHSRGASEQVDRMGP
jgi:hypothetical protein